MKNIKRAMKLLAVSCIVCISITVPSFASQNVSIQIYQQPNNLLKPGSSEIIKFVIKNNTNQKMTLDKIYMMEKSKTVDEKPALSKGFEEMAKYTDITIKQTGNESNKVKSGLKDMLGEKNGVNLKNNVSIYPGKEQAFDMTIDMNEAMGNDAQSLSKVFSLGTVYNLTSTGGGGGTTSPDKPTNPNKPINQSKPGQSHKPSNSNRSNVGGSTDKLPQTGSIINSTTLTVLGIAVAGLGVALDRKSSDKGGKSDE